MRAKLNDIQRLNKGNIFFKKVIELDVANVTVKD